MAIPLVDLQAQYHGLQTEIDAAIKKVIEGGSFIMGKALEEFEQAFAYYCEAEHAVGVASGTDALHLALRACGVEPGDEVIVPVNTYIATALAVSFVGAKPVFVDVVEETALMEQTKVEQAITLETKAIIPVHLYGRPVEMEPLLELAHRHNLKIIEDACQAHGARYKSKRVGALGEVGCFSFYPAKNLGAFGDGGAVVTNDPDIADRVRMLRNYGQKVKYYHLVKGWNSRLDTLQAAILSVKLKRLDQWNAARRRHAKTYRRLLGGQVGITLFAAPSQDVEHVYHLFVARVPERDRLLKKLGETGIGASIHYPIPIHLQDAYNDMGYEEGDFPVAEMLAQEIISLPMYPELDEEKISQVTDAVIGHCREVTATKGGK